MKLTNRQGFVFYLLVQTLILTVFYWDWLIGTKSYFFRDLTHYIEPFAIFTGDLMRKLELPLWNPWCYCGMSQMAITVQGICYPPTLLFALAPFSSALASSMILHQLICGAGGFLLASSLGWGLLPSLLCASTLAMSGYEFCFSSIFSLVESSAWCPVSIWALYKLGSGDFASPDAGKSLAFWTFISAFLISMHVLAGHPELSSIQFALIFSFIALSAYKDWRQNRNLLVAGSRLRAVMLAILLAMPMILPAYEWYRISRRSGGLDPSEALTLSANWYDLLGLILPQPLGDMQQRWSEFRPLVMKGQLLPYMASAFVGPVVITLAIWSIKDISFKLRYVLPLLLLMILLLALGENAPLAPFILQITKSAIRFPVKVMFFAVWCLAIMAARGLYCLIEADNRAYLLSALFWGLFASVALLPMAGIHLFTEHLLLAGNQGPEQIFLAAKCEKSIATAALFASACGLAISALAYLYKRGLPWLKHFPAFLVAGSAASLLVFAVLFCRPAGPADFFQKPSLANDHISKLLKTASADLNCKGKRVLGLYLEHFTVPAGFLGEDRFMATVNTYQYSRQMLRANTNIDFKTASSFGFEGTCTGDYYNFFNNCYGRSTQAYGIKPQEANDLALAAFCRASSTGFVLSQIYRYADSPEKMLAVPYPDRRFFEPVYENLEANLRILKVKDSMPRAYLSRNWKFCDRSLALDHMFLPEKYGFDPCKLTLIEGEENFAASAGNKSGASSELTLEDKSVNEVLLKTNSDEPAVLVLCDQYYPGWQAFVDGEQNEIRVANCFFRAVYLPAGRHTVRFIYNPASFYMGLLLAGLAVLWLAVICWQSRSAKIRL